MKVKILAAVLLSALLLTISPPQINNQASAEQKQTQHTVSAATTEKVAQDPITANSPQLDPKITAIPESKTEQPSAEEEAKAFIYFKESSNNPSAENPSGCYGLGQDCNGIVKDKCGTDYQCQDDFFTDYMKRRYGTWQAAKSHWLAAVLINGRYVGNWW